MPPSTLLGSVEANPPANGPAAPRANEVQSNAPNSVEVWGDAASINNMGESTPAIPPANMSTQAGIIGPARPGDVTVNARDSPSEWRGAIWSNHWVKTPLYKHRLSRKLDGADENRSIFLVPR